MTSAIGLVKGMKALGKKCGIKKDKPDMGIIFSEKPCNATAVYTSNSVKGAPLYVTKEHLKNGKAQAIVITSGVANVCTGKKGIEDAIETSKYAAKELGINYNDVLIASTGIIGHYLPMERIREGLSGIKEELSKDGNVAEAILTTDSCKKEAVRKIGNCTIGGIAKGSGMVHPNMATMLAFICTDADFSHDELKAMLKESVNKSFNMLSVDMDTSTSDMCILMANGMAGKAAREKFQKALDEVCIELAKKIASDGEGATKIIEVQVKNAADMESAKKLAKSVVCSNLVKCAVYGNDPNWGRILCALGNSGADFDEYKVDLYYGNISIVKNGVRVGFDYKIVKEVMAKEELKITVDMKSGKESAIAYGCDMSEEYVKENSLCST